MRLFLSLLAVGILLGAGVGSQVAKAEEYDAIDESSMEADAFAPRETNMLVRLKSGVSYPAENGEVSHFMPITLDWSYTGFGNFALGAEFTWASGSHEARRFDMGTLQPFSVHLSKTMAVTLGTADYRFQWGNARVMTGAKLGAIFYRDSSTLVSGATNVKVPANHSETVFTAGPSLSLDMPVKGQLFVSLGGDYLFSGNSTQFGSLYAGLGADF